MRGMRGTQRGALEQGDGAPTAGAGGRAAAAARHALRDGGDMLKWGEVGGLGARGGASVHKGSQRPKAGPRKGRGGTPELGGPVLPSRQVTKGCGPRGQGLGHPNPNPRALP